MGTFLRLSAAPRHCSNSKHARSRDRSADLNRAINAESANLQRAVAASARQLEAIEALEADGRLAASHTWSESLRRPRDIPRRASRSWPTLELHVPPCNERWPDREACSSWGDEVGERLPTHWRA